MYTVCVQCYINSNIHKSDAIFLSVASREKILRRECEKTDKLVNKEIHEWENSCTLMQ